MPSETVVVGLDGSGQSRVAAWWAGREADLRGAQQLRLVAVSEDPKLDDELRTALQDVAEQCGQEHPHVAVTEELAQGHPAVELLRCAANAQVLVVGSRGRGGFASALLGSVSTTVAMHGQCPVVVVRDHRTRGPVVVGLDGSPASRAALQFAFDAAAARDTDLVAVEVCLDIASTPFIWAAPIGGIDWEALENDVRRELAEQLAGWEQRYPQVAVRSSVPRGHPVVELTNAAHDAQLLVVGHRGHGGFTGMLLGSVASGVLHHASCPVAVVRDESP